MRSRTERPSASEIMVTLSRLGRNRRLVLRLEWLTLCPTSALLPVNSHRRDMAKPFVRWLARAASPKEFDRSREGRTYSGEVPWRQAERPGCSSRRVVRSGFGAFRNCLDRAKMTRQGLGADR